MIHYKFLSKTSNLYIVINKKMKRIELINFTNFKIPYIEINYKMHICLKHKFKILYFLNKNLNNKSKLQR